MGCIQSKEKSKDISNGGGNNVSENSSFRNGENAIQTDKHHQPTKHPHQYNTDPLVRGRVDVYEPSLDSLDTDDMKVKGNYSKDDPTQVNDKSHFGNDINDATKIENPDNNNSRQNSFKSNHQLDEQINNYRIKEKPKMVSVFVAGETDSVDGVDDVREQTEPVSTSQVDMGNIVHEITYGQQFENDESVFIADEGLMPKPSDSHQKPTKTAEDSKPYMDKSQHAVFEPNQEVSESNQDNSPHAVLDSKQEAMQKVDDTEITSTISNDGNKDNNNETTPVEEGYFFRESSAKEFGSHNVRYFNKDKLEYGLPEGVPKPAPPKSRKADIIGSGTFTIAEKLAEQTPDNAFGSMQKLSNYLTGEGKKSELEAMETTSQGANLPPIRPTKTRKKDIIKDIEMFRKIDENAKKTPESVKMSVERLAKHLCSVTTTDLEKVRALYFWICNNIGYMFDQSRKSTDILRYDAVSTLRQGQGSYVSLMMALCKEVNIPVVTIHGCSKGLRHEPEKKFLAAEQNHSWNAVYISGEWRFMDCTWGSGFVDTHGKFRRQFDEFWFLTDPEVFVYDHFPMHEIWQLLDDPIDIDEFNSRPSLTEKSREYGIQLMSHREPVIYLQNEVTVTFGTKEIPLSNITADLRDAEGREVNRHRCMEKVDGKMFSIRVIPPDVGQYALIIYGKAKDYRHAKFMKLMEYMLRCDHVYPEKVIFPDHLKAWGAEPNYSDQGFAKSIENLSVFKSETNEMTITLEQTRNVSLIPELKAVRDLKTELKDYAMITARKLEKLIHLRFPKRGYYKLDIYSEREEEKYEFSASFLIECTASDIPAKLPKYNASSICKNTCQLLEPLTQEIPANSTVVVRLKSRGLRSAMVGIPMEKDYGSRLKSIGELVKKGEEFLAQINTPEKGETIYLSGCAAPPNVFWSRLYEFVTV